MSIRIKVNIIKKYDIFVCNVLNKKKSPYKSGGFIRGRVCHYSYITINLAVGVAVDDVVEPDT